LRETVYLDIDDLLVAAERALGHHPEVRDWGLLESALARPRASVFGEDAYPEIHAKAAALLHSLVTNHALVDGYKRLSLVAMLLFYGFNDYRLTATQDERVNLVLAVAEHRLEGVEEIAQQLAGWAVGR
jgi:death-on-curing protein